MKATNYQTPKLSILALQKADVITASGDSATQDGREQYDKGVVDFFTSGN